MQKEIRIKDNRYDVCVNYHVECLGVLLTLGNFSLNKPRSNGQYLEKVWKWFGKFKDHDAVKKLLELTQNQYFRYNGPVEMFLKISLGQPLNEEFCQRFGLSVGAVKEFLAKLENFIKVTNFDKFFAENQETYAHEAEKFIAELKDYSPTEFLMKFLKMKAKKLNVLLMFSVSTSNYGIEVGGQAYCCVRPYKQSRDQGIDFTYDKPYVTTLILHEWAHTVINPLTHKFLDKVNQIDKTKFALCFEQNSYGDDIETVVNEHVIRAIECLYVKKVFASSYEEFLLSYQKDGFECLPQLVLLYEKYLQQGGKYPTFADYYAKVLDFFAKEKKLCLVQ